MKSTISFLKLYKNIRDSIEATKVAEEEVVYGISDTDDKDEIRANIDKLKSEMMEVKPKLTI